MKTGVLMNENAQKTPVLLFDKNTGHFARPRQLRGFKEDIRDENQNSCFRVRKHN